MAARAIDVRVARQRRPVCEYRHAAGGRRPAASAASDWPAGGVTNARALPAGGRGRGRMDVAKRSRTHAQPQRTHRHRTRPDGGSAQRAAWGVHGRACAHTHARARDHGTLSAATFRRRCVQSIARTPTGTTIVAVCTRVREFIYIAFPQRFHARRPVRLSTIIMSVHSRLIATAPP